MTAELDLKTRIVDLGSIAFDGFDPQATNQQKHINTFRVPDGRAIEFSTRWGTRFRIQDENTGIVAVSRNHEVVLRVGRGNRSDDGRRTIYDDEQRVIGWVRSTGKSRQGGR